MQKVMQVYAIGICSMSMCVPKGASIEEIEKFANQSSPTGISSKWKISDETFSGGEPNPCVCSKDPENLYYLLNC